MKNFRHGDLIFTKIDQFPEELNPSQDNVLAHGEVTGHKHVLTPVKGEIELFVDSLGSKYFEVEEEAELTHEEHKTVIIPKGKYKMHQEREFDYVRREIQRVKD